MPQEILRQGNFTAGALDPKLRGRRDIKAYVASVELMENVIARPQGEMYRRPGLAAVSQIRKRMQAVSLDAATITSAHEGPYQIWVSDEGGGHWETLWVSDADDIRQADGNAFRTLTALGVTNPYVVFEIDFGTAQVVGCVDLIDYVVLNLADMSPPAPPSSYPWGEAGSFPATSRQILHLQYEVGGVWHNFGAAQDMGTILRTRRVSLPPSQSVSARKWRLIKTGGVNWGARVFQIDAVRFWRESATLSDVRIWRFSFDSEEQQYLVLATDYNADVFRNDQYVSSFAIPYGSDDIRFVTRTQSMDTLLTFHKSFAPQRLTRQGAHDQWDIRPAQFKNVPLFDYDGTNIGAVNGRQDIKFRNYSDGDQFTLVFDGEETSPITYITSSAATMSANIRAALEALNAVGEGNVSISGPASNVYRIEFINQLGGADVPMSAARTISASNAAGIVYVDVVARGRPGGEPIMSALRGWPACGCFYQERLYLGGFRSRPQTILASRLGEYFDYGTRGAKEAAAIDVTISTNRATTIHAIFPGRNLQVFTNSSEFYFPTEPIVPVPAIKQATTRGIRAGTPIFEMDGATLFTTFGGGALTEFQYSDAAQNYVAPHLSVLWSHLVKDVVDVGYRRALNTTETDQALCVRADGGAAIMTALRSEEVLGFADVLTDGDIIASTGEINGNLYVVVKRGEVMTFERFDDAHMLDASVSQSGVVNVLTGLTHLNGRDVRLYIDGGDAGTAAVIGGQVSLPFPSQRSAEAGLFFQPRIITQPGIMQEDPRGGGTSRARTGTVELDLGPTAHLKVGIVNGRKWDVTLKRRPDALLDHGPGENPFVGWAKVQGIPGYRPDAQIEIIQDAPGPLCIRQIVATVNT